MRQELRKILARVFVALLIFLIGVVIYKQGNPYAYPGLENRILFVLVPSGIVLLYLYLEERETRNRLFFVIMVTIGRLHESKFMRFCESIWESSPSLVHVRVSKVLAVVYTYIHKMSGYMLKQDPKEVVSHVFLGMLLIVALQSVIPQPPLEWAKTPVMIAAVALGVVTFYLNRDKLGEIEEEARQEEVEEKRREVEFAEKYPRIDRFLGVRWVVRWMYKEGWWYSGILIIVIGLSIVFMLNHLGQFMSVDEPKWFYTRVPQLYESILTLDFAGTYINDKPGILPAALSGIAFLFLNPSAYTPETFEKILFWWRLPIVLFNTIMLIIIYTLFKKLFDKSFAVMCISLIALNPIIIGINQIVNPDATLWSTGLISFLSFFLYLKTNNKKYSYISGFFLGLALISKYFSAYLYIVFILSIVIEYILIKRFKIEHLNARLYDLFILIGISIIVFTIFFPATWINPEYIYKGTIGASILSAGYPLMLPGLFILFFDSLILNGKLLNFLREINLDRVMRWFSLFVLIYTGSLIFNLFLNEPLFDLGDILFHYSIFQFSKLQLLIASSYITMMTLIPTLFLGLLLYFFIHVLKGNCFFKSSRYPNITIILYSATMFIVTYIVGASIGGHLVNSRYQIMLYPMYCILAISAIVSLVKKEKVFRAVTVSIILLNVIVLLQSVPFYIHYTNMLNINNDVITDAWGYGGYEMAQKMNELPNAKNISVWTDREGLSEFFIGKTYWRGGANPFELQDVEYLVLTYGGDKIFTSAAYDWKQGERYFYAFEATNTPILEYYNKTGIYQININGNEENYVKLVKINISS